MNWVSPGFLEFDVFFGVLLFVEVILLGRAFNWVSKVGIFAIEALECVRARITLLSFEPRRIWFGVSFTIPSKLTMMFSYMRAIAFYAFGSLDMAYLCWMTSLPTILTLRDTRIYIGVSHHDDTSYIKTFINNFLSIITVFGILYVNPDNSHVRFRRDLDNAWFWCEDDIIKDMIILEDAFNIFRKDTSVGFVNKVWNAHSFKVGLWLRKSERRNAIIICNKGTLNIFFNLLEIRICSYIVCWYNDAFVVCTNKISANVGFDAFESPVNIDNIWRWILNKSFTKIATHGNNNLFSR